MYLRYISGGFSLFVGLSIKVPKKRQICYTVQDGYDRKVSPFRIAITRQALQRKQHYRGNLYLLTEC